MTPDPLFRIVNRVLRFIIHRLVRLDVDQLKKIPSEGAFIAAGNHVNFLDAPIIATHMDHRSFTALAKVETWKNPLIGYLFDKWGSIPIRRGEVDWTAMQACEQALKDGTLLAIAPEGTRSGDGKLGKGMPGIVLLASRSKVPLIPVVYYGHENYKEDWKHFRRPHFHVVVGEPFRLNLEGVALSRDVREQVADEIMWQLSALLPEKYRGYYTDLSKATEKYLLFEKGSESNLKAPVKALGNK
jgi:1-acyl-sn-glycerol-3-phosphate acyltransferase